MIEAINDGEQASALIRNDTQTPTGAEELLKLLPDEYDEEAFLRKNLLAFRDVLNNGEPFEYTYEEQEWVLTQTTTGHTRNLWFEIEGGPAHITDGDARSSSCDFISCSSGVEDVEIDGTSISMTFNHHDWNGTEHFVVCKGTLSDNGTHIADGAYYENGTLLGSFTADRTFFDQETIGLNMSRFFGDGTGPDANGPFNLSDFLPEFSAGGDPVPGTMGSGLGRDPTQGGILPDWTQQDWLEPLDFDEDGPDLATWTEIAVYNDKLAAGFSILPSFSTFLEGAVLLGPNDFFYRFDLENDAYDIKTKCSGSAGWWQEFNSTLGYGRYHLILDFALDEDVKEVFSSELSRLDLPRIQGATMTHSLNNDGSIDFNWTAPAADLHYRVRIYDSQMNRVFKSDLFENATLHVPAGELGCLEQNGSYQWQVRVYDPETWQHVSKSDLVDLVYDRASLGKRIVWFMVADSKGQKIVGFDVRPGSRSNVLKATVIGPDTGNGTFTHIFDLDQAWYDVSTETRTNKGWWSDAGEPLPTGQYRLEVILADGTTENATDQFNAVTVIPVDSGTMYSQNHWDGMWFDWDVPQGGESQYYDLRIRNLDRSKEYLKRRFSGNDSGIWLSLWDLRALTPGQQYQWFIRAYDSEFPYSTMAKSASQYFTYSPLGIAETPSTSFPITGSVMNYRTARGDFTFLDIFIGTGDFQGNLLSNIASVSISGPNNLSRNMADLEYWSDPYWNGGGFNVMLDVPPAEGEYTFSVRYTNGDVFNSTDYQGPIKEIPIPDQGQMSPGSGAVVATKPPTFSWGAVSVPDTGISYRLQIRETGGGVVFASDRQAGILSMTVPVDTLEPGKAYEWRVRATDSSNWVEVDNRAQTDYIPFTVADTPNRSPSPPAIDLDGWGVVNYSTQDGHALSSWIKIVDQDGVSSDGSSHTVTVTYPNATERTLDFRYNADGASGYYEDWSWQGNTPPPSGNYTFTVTDAGNNTFSVTDELIVNTSLGVPDEASFSPVEGAVLNSTTPTFTWDPVPGAVRYRVRIYSGDNNHTVWNGYLGNCTSWTAPPGILEPYTDYRYRIEARSEHSPLDIDNNAKGPASWDNIRFTTGSQVQAPAIDLDSSGVSIWSGDPFGTNTEIWVKIHDAQGVPDNIQSVSALTPDNATVPLFLYRKESETRAAYLGWTFAPPQSGEYSIKVVDKDGNSYTKKEYLTAAPLDPPAVDSLSASFNGTAYEVNWDEVNGAAFYRLEIYDLDYNRIYRFATTKSEYSLPAGFLKSGALYRYRITSRREFFDQNVDNVSVAPWFYTSRPTLVHKPTTGNNPPRISLDQDNYGVTVWHTPDPATSASDSELLSSA